MVLRCLEAQEYENQDFLEEVLKETCSPEGYTFSDEAYTSIDISEVCFTNCTFYQCYFSKCDFSSTSFVNCTFQYCYMNDCDLYNTDFQNSTIEGIGEALGLWLDKCNLESASFDGADIEGLYMEDCEISGVVGLKTPPSEKGAKLVNCRVSPIKGMGLIIASVIGSVVTTAIGQKKSRIVKNIASTSSQENTTHKHSEPSMKAYLFCSNRVKSIVGKEVLNA